jgi:hypothetical protein
MTMQVSKAKRIIFFAVELAVAVTLMAIAGHKVISLSTWLTEINNPVPIISIMIIMISLAAAGAFITRRQAARWPELVLAVLPGATVFAAYRLVRQYMYQNPFYPSYYISIILTGLAFVIVISAGIFLLPLLDPLTRKAGPVLNRRQIMIAAVLTVLLLVGGEAVREMGTGGYYSFFGLLSLYLGSLLSIVALGAGLLLTIAKKPVAGAWMGAYGVIVWGLVLIAWAATGLHWFP